MQRRDFLASLAALPALRTSVAGAPAPASTAPAAGPAASRQPAVPTRTGGVPRGRVTRVRIYQAPTPNPLFNQSNMLCTVETDFGITGIGEGGSKDTLEQCAGTLIGKDPFKIEAIWQEMFIAWFYPPGREKTHALGALDLALWDIKGKALGLPLHELLGGSVRNFCECYGTAGLPAEARGGTPPGQAAGGRG